MHLSRIPPRICVPATVCLLLFAAVPVWSQEKDRRREEADAARYYEKWVNEDVLYLITDDERAVFEALTTPDEKDQFIEQFWHRRDTDLTTAINEYQEEHYRRIAYANQKFGSGIPGWKTDRGRIYIMFGEPAEIEYNAGGGTYVRKPYEGGGRTATFPFEVWRYRHIPGVGDDIEIEFVDRSMTGEFKMALYPWEKDMLLHVDGMGETFSERLGLTQRNYRPGLHPGNLNNTNYMTKYMGARAKDAPFERLRQYFNVQRPPQIKQTELQTIVETQVSYSLLPISTFLYHVWIDEDSALVPITLEVPNQHLQYTRQGPVYKARVALYGRITSLLGEVVGEFEDVLASEYQARFLEAGRTQFSLYQKTFTLAPGRYKVELVVKDLTSGNLGTVSRSIQLKEPEGDRLTSGAIVLAKKLETLDAFPEKPTSFVIGDVQVVPHLRKTFRSTDPLGVYLQVYNPTLDSASLEPQVEIEYAILKGSEVIFEVADSSGESVEFFSSRRLVLLKKLGLGELAEGRYRLRVRVTDSISGQSSSSQADFEILG